MTDQIPNPKSRIPNWLAWTLLAFAGCHPAVNAQPKADGPAAQVGGPLEVVMAGLPVKKTLTLVTTQPGRRSWPRMSAKCSSITAIE
jgi:hypothetical protein